MGSRNNKLLSLVLLPPTQLYNGQKPRQRQHKTSKNANHVKKWENIVKNCYFCKCWNQANLKKNLQKGFSFEDEANIQPRSRVPSREKAWIAGLRSKGGKGPPCLPSHVIFLHNCEWITQDSVGQLHPTPTFFSAKEEVSIFGWEEDALDSLNICIFALHSGANWTWLMQDKTRLLLPSFKDELQTKHVCWKSEGNSQSLTFVSLMYTQDTCVHSIPFEIKIIWKKF